MHGILFKLIANQANFPWQLSFEGVDLFQLLTFSWLGTVLKVESVAGKTDHTLMPLTICENRHKRNPVWCSSVDIADDAQDERDTRCAIRVLLEAILQSL